MDFKEQIFSLSDKVEEQADMALTEEATKTAFIMPFIHNVLGYDIFNPAEVIPEYTADIGVKKGEKVDYAIIQENQVQILIEAKKIGDDLSFKHADQLYRYFSVTSAKIAILTNGQIYQFYTDLDEANRMDKKPFLTLDLIDIDDHVIPELKKITKKNFNLDSIISAAGELKYLSQIKKIFAQQLIEPDYDFVRFFTTQVYDGQFTQKVREQFSQLTIKAFTLFLNDKINNRLKSAMSNTYQESSKANEEVDEIENDEIIEEEDDGIITTIEEIEGFNIVKAIVRKYVDANRIEGRDTKSYFGILLDYNNRKPICRLHFNSTQKYIGLFDENKKQTRVAIDSLDDIFKYEEQLKTAALSYDNE